MTAIDFSAFVNELATVSGETILPFFRTALSVTDKGNGQFDPVTAADHAAETAMRTLIRRTFPDHGVVGEEFGNDRARRRICLGARPDRRHQVLHGGDAGLGHADRADAIRRTGVRRDEPALHRRALQRRRRRGALPGSGRQSRPAGAHLRGAVRSGAVHHQPAADERRRPQRLPEGRGGGEALALRRRLLRLLHAGGGPCRSRHRDRAQALRRDPAGADHHRRRRHRHHLGERLAGGRRPHRRRQRQARARGGAGDAQGA